MQRQRLLHKWIVFLLLGCIALPALASAEDDWLHEFDEAVAAAKQQGKDILIDFSVGYFGKRRSVSTNSLSWPLRALYCWTSITWPSRPCPRVAKSAMRRCKS